MKKCLLLLALSASLFTLSACGRNDEAEAAEKLAYFSRVYPTQKVSDLFDKFPKGFELQHSEVDQTTGYDYFFKLTGDSATMTLTGTYEKQEYVEGEVKTLATIPISYSDETGFLSTDNQELDDFARSRRFLFSMLSFKNKESEEFIYDSTFVHPISGFVTLDYKLTSPPLQEYLQVNSEIKLEIHDYTEPKKRNKLEILTFVSVPKTKLFISEYIREIEE